MSFFRTMNKQNSEGFQSFWFQSADNEVWQVHLARTHKDLRVHEGFTCSIFFFFCFLVVSFMECYIHWCGSVTIVINGCVPTINSWTNLLRSNSVKYSTGLFITERLEHSTESFVYFLRHPTSYQLLEKCIWPYANFYFLSLFYQRQNMGSHDAKIYLQPGAGYRATC